MAGGQSNVKVIRPGEQINWSIVKRRVNGEHKNRRHVKQSGEEYAINCPYCHDSRQRLLINHRFGTEDAELGQRQTDWLAQCLNETRCLDSYDRQRDLHVRIYGIMRRRITMRESSPETVVAHVGPVTPPGTVVSLRQLNEKKPDHAALAYLRSRGYDPVALSDLYDIGFVYNSAVRAANNRIYIPIEEKGKLCGWQCRYIGDDVDGVTFTKARVAKYYTQPGYRKTDHLYNFERALECPTAVLVEGAIDVWGFGRQAVGTFGCKLSYLQAELLVKAWRRRHKRDTRIVVLYDPEMEKHEIEKAAKGRKAVHHIDRAKERLAELIDVSQVLAVRLPGGDPGSLDPHLQRQIIRKTAKREGIEGIVLLPPDPVRL